MIRAWLSDGANPIYPMVAFFFFAFFYSGLLVYLLKNKKPHFKRQEEMPLDNQ